MKREIIKVILNSQSGYDKIYDSLLENLIDEKVLLFCAVGKDCKLWHDVMDEFFVGNGEERDFFMITAWHAEESLEEVIKFAKDYDIQGIDNEKVEIIEV